MPDLGQHLADGLEDRPVRDAGAVQRDVHAVRKARLGEQLLGLLGIVGIGLDLAIEAEGERLHRGGDLRGEARHQLLHDGLLVDRVVRRLPRRLLVEGRRPHVELDVVDAQDRRRGDVGLRMGLELGRDVGGDFPDDVDAARLDLRVLRGVLGDGAEDEVLERRLAAPVLVEGLEADELVALPLDELPRARADGRRRPEGLIPDGHDVLLGDDAEVDEALEQEREGLVRDDVNGLGVDHLHFLDRADIAVLRRLLRLVEHPLERST